MFECKKCGTVINSVIPPITQLAGGRYTYLCIDCANLWHEYVTNHSVYEYLERVEALINRAYYQESESRVLDLKEQRHDLLKGLYVISGDWLKKDKE